MSQEQCNCPNLCGVPALLVPRCNQTAILADCLSDESGGILVDSKGTALMVGITRIGTTAAFEYERIDRTL